MQTSTSCSRPWALHSEQLRQHQLQAGTMVPFTMTVVSTQHTCRQAQTQARPALPLQSDYDDDLT